ncbi:cGMP-dependent protein kinase 1 [Hydra vulgaris]|uniref:cGMP-dependent protein kinase n=1 Tax=Hydra vulgaris TaxID=6087 RepID=A0ABM4CV64_HYDVU
MGNSASLRKSTDTMTVDGEKLDFARLKHLYPKLRQDLKKKDELIDEKNKKLSGYELEILNLKKEIRQLQSVIEATRNTNITNDVIIEEEDEDKNGNSLSRHSMNYPKARFIEVVKTVRNKRFAVSAESGKELQNLDFPKIPKSTDVKEFISQAVLKNNFLKHLEECQVKEIVLFMTQKSFKRGEYIIKEGDMGNALFVSYIGQLEISQGDKILGKPLRPGELFGELAILYNCTRTASVKAIDDVEVWYLERHVFQAVMQKTGIMRREEHYNFLHSVPVFKDLPNDTLLKIVEVIEEEFYEDGEFIVREGERGDSFYILKQGLVKVLQMIEGKDEPVEIRQLSQGEYFGEKALLGEDVRTASVVASTGGVHCLVIERDIFMSFIGDLSYLKNKDYGDKLRKAVNVSRANSLSSKTIPDAISPEFLTAKLTDFKLVATLGVGGFGRVELVQDKRNKERTYALKSLSKHYVVETKQQEHVFNEKKILMSLDSQFVIKLYKTFKDDRYVYLLLEVCLGGELWTILRDRDYFEEAACRFYVACVVEAFEYIHKRGIIYRDLKPENLLMDSQGYIKIVDFGFAKKIPSGTKTWTFCGTPEYVPPEIILNKGHDSSADYWSLGILIYELMVGNPPFTSSDPMSTYNIILRGIEVLEFSNLVTKNAQNLIKRLCKENPMERLGNQKDGVDDIRKHKWYQGFHWSGLRNRSLQAPIVPKIRNITDNSNFDYFSPLKEKPQKEFSGWDEDF